MAVVACNAAVVVCNVAAVADVPAAGEALRWASGRQAAAIVAMLVTAVEQVVVPASRIPMYGPVAVTRVPAVAAAVTESRIRMCDPAVEISLGQETGQVAGQLVPVPKRVPEQVIAPVPAVALRKANLTTSSMWAAAPELDPAVAPDRAAVPAAQPVTFSATGLKHDPVIDRVVIDRESDNPEIVRAQADLVNDPVIVREPDPATAQAHGLVTVPAHVQAIGDRRAVAQVEFRKTTGTNVRRCVIHEPSTCGLDFARIPDGYRAGIPLFGAVIPIGVGAGGDKTSTGGGGEPGPQWLRGGHGAGHSLGTGTGA